MQAVAYIRVSTEEQVSGTSLDSQEKACLEYARNNNITLSKDNIFREEGVSAKLIDRPKLSRMIDYCGKNKDKISHCIVWKVDRLARRSEYHHIIKARLAKNGVKLISVTEPIGDDPVGNLMDGMLAAFAQFDNDIRTARTTGGMRARTMQGGWPHGAPYGYKRSKSPSGITTVAPGDNASLLTEFLNEFSTGAYTVKQAADLAYRIGIRGRAGNKILWQPIRNIISSPLYAGYVCTKFTDHKMIKGLHKPLIDEKIFYKNLSILNGNFKHYSREAVEDWPLRSGFLRHTCGKPMTGSSPRGRSGPSPRYSCPQCKARQTGKRTSKMRQLVHDDFLQSLRSVRPTEGAKRLFKEIVLRQWNQEFKQGIELSSKIDQQLAVIMTKKSRVLDLFIEGKLTDAQKDEKTSEIEAEATNLKLQRIDAGEYVSNKEKIIDGALLFMSNPDLFWNQSGLEIKKRIQDSVFPEGLIYDCEEGFGTAKLSDSYLLIQEIALAGDSNPILVAATGFEPVTLGL